MTLTLDQATQAIYDSLDADNMDIDLHIDALKGTLVAEEQSEFAVDPAKLAQNNRAGRKMMQSYFKKRGVKVSFSS